MLKPGGRLAFYNIFMAPGLSEDERQRGLELAPGWVYSPVGERAMLRSAGFARIKEIDVTDEFLRTEGAVLEGRERYAEGLRTLEGAAEFSRRQLARKMRIEAIEADLVRRSLFVAERPSRR